MISPLNALAAGAAFGAVLFNSGPAAAEQGQGARAICAAPNAPAAVHQIVAADTPQIALLQGQTGTAVVEVSLSETGQLTSATIASSSGYRWLDLAALSSVREQKYSPELSDCRPVSGSYLIDVEFNDTESSNVDHGNVEQP